MIYLSMSGWVVQSHLFILELWHKSTSLPMMQLSPSNKSYIFSSSRWQQSLLQCGLGHIGFLEYGGWLIKGDWIKHLLILFCRAPVAVAIFFLLCCIKKDCFLFLRLDMCFFLFREQFYHSIHYTAVSYVSTW